MHYASSGDPQVFHEELTLKEKGTDYSDPLWAIMQEAVGLHFASFSPIY